VLSVFPIFIASISLIYKSLLFIAIIASLLIYRTREIKRNGLLIRYKPELGWEIALQGNDYYSIEVLPSTVITSFFIVLHFKRHKNKKQTTLIAKDALIDDEFRKLMVLLKISGVRKDGNEPK